MTPLPLAQTDGKETREKDSSLGYEILPSSSDLPALMAAYGAGEASHPVNTIRRRHSRGELRGLSVFAILLCEAERALLRVWRILFVRHPQWKLALHICTSLQKLVGHSLAFTSQFSL